MAGDTTVDPEGKKDARPTRRFPRSRVNEPERRRLREDVREVDFPIALRGYDRAAVDRYVEQVNRVIAELEISSSPESAIRHALGEVSEETSGILQRAYDTADEITARSRAKADDRLEQAKQEAQELRETAAREADETRETAQQQTQELRATAVRDAHEEREAAAQEAYGEREAAAQEARQARAKAEREVEVMCAAAEARVRELDGDAEAIWRERRRLIEDMRDVAQQQLEIIEAAATRFPRPHELADRSVSAGEPGEPVVEEERVAAGEPTATQPQTDD